VSNCTSMRWRIPQFLNGELPDELMEEMREHLDLCPDCAVVLAHPARVEAARIAEESQLSPDFTERLLGRLPVSFTGYKLACIVGLAFAFSGVFGVGIWAGIKWLLGSAQAGINAAAAAPAGQDGGMLTNLMSPSTLQYLGLGLLAVVACFIIIAVVDIPRSATETTREKA